MLPDAAEARHISAHLATLKQQRAQGSLPHEEMPLRLYRLRPGSYVRVLDQHPEPISQGMLEAIDTFVSKVEETAGDKERNRTSKKKRKQSTEKRGNDETEKATQSTLEHEKSVKACKSVNIAEGETMMAVSTSKPADGDGGVAKMDYVASASVSLVPPWECNSISRTPHELVAKSELVSEYLGKHIEGDKKHMTAKQDHGAQLNKDTVTEEKRKSWKPVDHSTLFEQWPPQLIERRKLWFVSKNYGRIASANGLKHQPVVYWMHNTLRVMQGNFGLEAAILLSRRLGAPLVVLSLIPSSIIYPICHSTSASEAYGRFSLVELYQQFSHANVPFLGLTASASERSRAPYDHQSLSFQPNPLYVLLDTFEPLVVVADVMFDSPSRNDLMRLARYLELNRSSCAWSLLSMDSLTCCPAYQLSVNLKSSFEPGAAFASEDQFGAEYATCSHARHGTYRFSPLPRWSAQDQDFNRQMPQILAIVKERLSLEEVNWHLVKAENDQSSSQMQKFSEGEGLQKLSQLLSNSDGQPAIQAELRGGGVLSLLPFIRHGTLFAGYVLRRISEAITACPLPTSSQDRKALAMRKVMRSRAASHLGKERDYALYLALWSTVHCASDTADGLATSDLDLLSTSEIIASLDLSSPRTSSLRTYQKLLPSWAFSAARIGNLSCSQLPEAALYLPHELESASTQDRYWNEIQKFIVVQQYLHPLLVVYWAYRLMTWNVSSRAAIATIDAILSQCALGSNDSPDAVFMVWKQLFRVGSKATKTGARPQDFADLRQFQRVLESEIASQPKLPLHS